MNFNLLGNKRIISKTTKILINKIITGHTVAYILV